ncbi:MAG TPA: LapA family protein [Verrucomicrobiae bacterium]|nr:LapA family protein [Verrucomicrobiae bacterium]
MGRLLVSLLLIATFCLGASVSYFNWTTVRFDYLAGQSELPLIALMLVAFMIGMLVMGLIDLARMFVLSREARRHAREIRELEAELRSLRNLPLAPPPAAAGTVTSTTKNA